MTVEEQLKDLIIEHSSSISKFASDCGLPYSTVATVFRRGVGKTNVNTIILICRELHISVDEILKGNIVPVTEISSQARDIDRLIDETKLTKGNLERLKAYYQGLLDSQKGQANE